MLMNLMKMKTGEKIERMKNRSSFYKCDVFDFETLFVDQFKQHKKWNHQKSKPEAEMEVSTRSGKRTMSVLANRTN